MFELDRQGKIPIVADGSMSIELARRGLTERPADRYNLTSPMVVERIHREFIDVGATLLQTNTLHANRYALDPTTRSVSVLEVNRKGVWLARTAAQGKVPVAGVLGPTGWLMHPLGPLDNEEILSCYTEQVSAVLAGGCDLIMLKSFINLDELELAIEAVRRVSADIPLIALKSFPEDGAVLSGSFPADVAHRITRHGVQAIGSNGTVGPQRMLGIITALRGAGSPLVALPDVGIPTLVDGVSVYDADPQYVASAAVRLVEAGASIIGAEGGATKEHVQAIALAVQDVLTGSKPITITSSQTASVELAKPEPPTSFEQALNHGFVQTVELDVPRGLDMTSVIEIGRAHV